MLGGMMVPAYTALADRSGRPVCHPAEDDRGNAARYEQERLREGITHDEACRP